MALEFIDVGLLNMYKSINFVKQLIVYASKKEE